MSNVDLIPEAVLDEKVWRAWKQRGQRRDRQAAAARISAVKYVCITALLATAIFWIYAIPYTAVLKTIVAAGAIVVSCQAVAARRYDFAAMFAAIVLLFNPFVRVFGSSGEWAFSIVVATVIPFAASLIWLKSRTLSSAA